MTAQRVDGNAIAGLLSEIFAIEPTTTITVCNKCGDQAVLAQSIVYHASAETEVRCSQCDDTLFTIVTRGSDHTLILAGLRLLRLLRTDRPAVVTD
jgi:hypothetical protein